ncbi:M20 aminoacylase family protein [Aquamicrobium sp.]|uniref:M20 aminoacylase family protein n=1 Tax=Aquamicrobium sp. TaxID=1872579 RepID=UPI0025881226|nr:M20 aminoacylase family protein [Aquamicrobium sp.]MCK9552970.1 M20 family metallopeptidase [Aquamicrobium sp.]
MTFLPFSADFVAELRVLWEDLHAHPELGFSELRTCALVAEKLRAWGVDEVHTGLAGTGVVGILRGGKPGERRIGLRADMDALPITEDSGLDCASTNAGVMHACGHDGHTTMLLGAARHLAANRQFAGEVVLIFQPAEEGLGGARRMLEEGLFRRFPCDEIYGLHNLPQSVTGRASIRPGPMMAGAAFFDIHLKGRGGHAARPHSTTDVVVAAADLVGRLQTVVSRAVNPLEPCVLSCTRLEAGNTYNVIPEKAHVAGTVRYFSRDVLERVRSRMDQICRGIAESHQVEFSLELRDTFRPLENTPAFAEAFADAAAAVLGNEAVDRNGPMSMGSEDFADMLADVPGAFLYLHHSGPETLHSPKFRLDPAVLPLGAAIFVQLVSQRLRQAG